MSILEDLYEICEVHNGEELKTNVLSGVCNWCRAREEEVLTVPEKHQLRIARDTLKMPDAMVGVMGGPTKEEAKEIIKRLTAR